MKLHQRRMRQRQLSQSFDTFHVRGHNILERARKGGTKDLVVS